MYIIAGHATLIDGKIYESPVNTLVETISTMNQDFIFIRHFMNGEKNSIVYVLHGQKIVSAVELQTTSNIAPLRYLKEIIATIKLLRGAKIMRPVYFIGADPLNGICGIVAKFLKLVDKSVFFSVDYSKSRFKNTLLNFIYHSIDAIAAKYSTQTWNVSSRILKIHQLQNLNSNSNLLLPNTPSNIWEKYKSNQKNPYKLITLSQIDEQLDFVSIISAVSQLKNEFPKIELNVYGNGKLLDHYRNYIINNRLTQFIFFHGAVSHDQALEAISTSGIGLAPYTGKWSFNFYGDSMKCREFLCFGLPIITTNNHSTADEIAQFEAGIVLLNGNYGYADGVRDILKSYDQFSENALILHKKYEGIHLKSLINLANSN